MCKADPGSHGKRQVISAPIQLLSGQAGCVVLNQKLKIQASGSHSTERCRGLLDEENHRSLITTKVFRKLRCKFIEEVLTIGVFGRKETNEPLRRVRVHLPDPTGEMTLSVKGLV